MESIFRVNMRGLKVQKEQISESYTQYGGRGLSSFILKEEVSPVCHPLDRHNKLIFAPGLLGGTMAPNSGRLSIGAKSPLTGTIKESNAGGEAGRYLGKLEIKGIIVEEIPSDNRLYCLYINKDKAELLSADELKGLGNYEAVASLRKKFGNKVAIISIGQAGEMKLNTATIAVTDMEGRPTRHAGRGGLGAVMGSKGLKAIIIDITGAEGPEYADKEAFKKITRRFNQALQKHPVTGQGLPRYGTNILMKIIDDAGALPTRYFQMGQFEEVEAVSGEKQYEIIKARGGKIGHPCHKGCVIRCSRIYLDKNGQYLTKGPEYETIWANGPNLGINDLDAIAQIDRLSDDYGVDNIEVGNAIGIAMKAGVISFGDAQGAIDLYHQIAKGTPLGRIIGSGAVTTAQIFGIARVAAVKGQSLPAYDPRAVKGIGVTYATSPMGADHTAGYTIATNILGLGGKIAPLTKEGQVALSKKMQVITAALDCTGLCLFCALMMADEPKSWDDLIEMINARYGWQWTTHDFFVLGERVLKIEREFNLKAGFTPIDDRLPEFFYEEPLPPHNSVFDIPDEEMQSVFEL